MENGINHPYFMGLWGGLNAKIMDNIYLVPDTVLNTSHILTHLSIITTSKGNYFYHPHVI